MSRAMDRWWAAWGLPALGAAVLLAVLYVITPVNMYLVMLGDGRTYTEMAGDLWHGAGHMHRYRILVPAIVGWLPLGVDNGFRFVAYLSSFLGALCTYGIVRTLTGPSKRAWLAVPLYLLTWPTLWNIYQYRLVDGLACAFAAAGLWLVLRGFPKTAILLAGIGALAKEAVILLIPLAAIVAARSSGRRDRLLLAASVILALMPSLAVRAIVEGAEGFSLHGEAGTGLSGSLVYLRTWPLIQLKEVGVLRSIFFTFMPFSVCWLLAPLGLRRVSSFQRRVLVGWLLLTAPLVLVGSPERMIEIQAPAVLPLAICALAGTNPALAALIVLWNGLFIMRIASDVVPWSVAWGSLGCTVAGALWVWWRALRIGWCATAPSAAQSDAHPL